MDSSKNDRMYLKLVVKIAIVLTVIGLLIDYRISVGMILGTVASFINYGLLNLQLTGIVLERQMNVISFTFGYLIRFACLFVPLLLGVIYPEYCNVWAVFVALLLFKIVMYFEGIRKKVL